MSFNVVGISAFYHDSACCILKDGVLMAAVQEERFSRKKNDPDLPKAAFLYCLETAGIGIADINCIAYYEDPVKKMARQLWSGKDQWDRSTALNLSSGNVTARILEELGYNGPVKYYDHHHSHAASSFFYSGFEDAAVFTIDGVGEWATTTYGIGRGQKLDIFEEVIFPDSLGLLYSTITSYLGFSVNSGEYKVMGLAPYGTPRYVDAVRALVEQDEKGQYRLNMKYFDFLKGEKMFADTLSDLFGVPPRKKETEILQIHQDIAKSLQVVLEEILIAKACYLHEQTGSDNLCMAGGVALNCVANGKVLKHSPFKNLFVQPAANDAGCALGAAALAYTELTGLPMKKRLEHVYLGPSFDDNRIARLLKSTALKHHSFNNDEGELLREIARRIGEGKVIGWFHGRMEFGPRSLGARSILADPRGPEMRDRINAMVKKREAFRPFAPAILSSETTKHFDLDHESPFMLETCQVISSLDLPAITHVDGSARVQTVSRDTNPRFAGLLKAFKDLTGCPILLNTSFNVRDEPIVCTPEEALVCFITTDIDCLVLENYIIDASDNDTSMLKMINLNLVERPEFEVNPNVYTFI
ncbi:carbamoyltransferase [Chitinophaga pendula]|uniref:carbamoyltransferase family protein n=1 Tax=Chitinophaga TaxID=79328 RepID=UPI000BB0678C|nr:MULTISPECIES: carbamoyltransferase [Chitinophaga]ASZ13292.1 carbamoyltransferase [Chitinophaga sp. MD30]UCJ09086.1 carbamoyltransferase [Chitinophaga pendula]